MRAVVAIDAGLGQAQPFYRTASHEMLLDDLLDVMWMHIAVPDGFGIDDHHRAVLALVQAGRLIGPNLVLETGLFDGIFKSWFQLLASPGKTTGTRGCLVALVGADKDMVLKTGIFVGFHRMWKDAQEPGLEECPPGHGF